MPKIVESPTDLQKKLLMSGIAGLEVAELVSGGIQRRRIPNAAIATPCQRFSSTGCSRNPLPAAG